MIFFISLAWMACTSAHAQNSVGEMDKKCSEWYAQASKSVRSTQCLAYADSMYKRGTKIHDHAAILKSKEIRVLHYSHFDDIKKLHEEAEALRKEAQANEEFRTYFYAYSLEIQNRLIYDHTLDALKYAKEMAEYAKKAGSAYGRYATLQSVGSVYYARKDYKKTIELLDSALLFVKSAQVEKPDLKTTSVYSVIAASYMHMRNISKAKETYETGLRFATNNTDSLTVLFPYTQLLGEIGEKNNFMDKYMLMKKAVGKNEKWYTTTLNLLNGYKCAFEGQYDKAEEYAKGVEYEEYRIRLLRNIYMNKKDFQKAYEFETYLVEMKDSVYTSLTNKDIAQLNKQLNNNELKHKAEKQAAELLHMQIMSIQKENEQMLMRAEASKLQEEAERKQAREDSLKSQALLNEMQMKRIIQEQAQQVITENTKRMHFVNTIMGLFIFLFLGAIIVTFFWIRRSRKTNKKLAMLTQELTEARNEALKTNMIKTLFIQNMNHEIRTQLNNVTGFAQILSSKDIAVSEEERLEYGKHITKNAQILNSLIDDILDNCRKSDNLEKMKSKG